ncbi:uncharacterized protein BO97DRAFT_424975 [Aspergillus homomorphus CBS 101889]|uniref:Uncharacterized protein n=1 Tax=Aspergillus homomorphus (strain CBS 101889) TaxID=1450537 RepID=A0A395HYV7_ASPHC|nr:hypothetical protein BO97DRAFT_424975 [Aspergillus homomorphus CBS 101889]RAL12048.1 hypothetical protein BO97DRAFT_424975 [Aspergillus homomorphus CBS 101889]
MDMPDGPSKRPIHKRVARCVSDLVDWDEDLRPSMEPSEATAHLDSTAFTSVASPSPDDTYTFNESHRPQGMKRAAKGKSSSKKASTARRRTIPQGAVKEKAVPKKRAVPVSDETAQEDMPGIRRKRLVEAPRHDDGLRSDSNKSPRVPSVDKLSNNTTLSPAVTDEKLSTLLPDKENMESVLSIFQIPEIDLDDGIELHCFDVQGYSDDYIVSSTHSCQSLGYQESKRCGSVTGPSRAGLYTDDTIADNVIHGGNDESERPLKTDTKSPHLCPESSMASMKVDRSWKTQEASTGNSHNENGSPGHVSKDTPSPMTTTPSGTSKEYLADEHRTPQSSSQMCSNAGIDSVPWNSPKKTPKNTIVDTNGSPRLLTERYKQTYKIQTLVLDETADSFEFYRGRATARASASFTSRLKLCAAGNTRPEISGPSQDNAVQKMLFETSESLSRHIESENTTISEIFESFRQNCHRMLDQLSEAQEARVRLCQQQMEGIRKHHSKICEELVHRMEEDEKRFQKILGIT